jgi:basic amino acid/polyamine antiporter, APA family
LKKLNRTLGLAECVFFGVGSILGAGIYTLIGKVAGWAGNMTWMAFLIASVTALFTAFSYAELSAAFPSAGGEYVYAKKAFGRRMGMALGFIISANGILSGSTVALGFGGYFSSLTGIPLLPAALGIIALIFAVNVSGIRESSMVNIVFTIIEAGGLLLVIYAAFPSVGRISYTELPPEGLNSLLTASALAFFAFIGFEEIVKLAEETRNPERNIPRALFLASVIVMVVYSLVAVCAVSVLTPAELGRSDSPLADIVNTRYGRTGVMIISLVALFSTSNTILSNMLGSSRVLLNMSQETKALKRFSYVSAGRRTPVSALVLILAVMCAFALIGSIETVARIANLFVFATFLIVNGSVIMLRLTEKNIRRPYRIPFGIRNVPVISCLGILLTLLLLAFNIYSFFRQS